MILKYRTLCFKSACWSFKAENVRDFAFASSRKFIWDAMGVKQSDGSIVMAMSMYPKEGNPLWERYSTKSVAHTLKWYSNYTFDYPYPVAWSIHTDRIGMEYPMICFNGGRPEADGTYTERTKYGLISVIIHEVGHNYFNINLRHLLPLSKAKKPRRSFGFACVLWPHSATKSNRT